MLRDIFITFLLLGFTAEAVKAAGSEPSVTEAPAAVPSPPAPAVSSAVPSPTAVDWTDKWGDLGDGYKAARSLIESERYAEGIAALEALNKPSDPRVLNWLGYAHRKLGHTDQAIAFYTEALSIAPDFTPAHEYLGEAYIQAKDLGKARMQLATIEQICGQDCKEYGDLKRSLDKASTIRGASADRKGSSR
ncbi:MAG: tetratricopeptide repeat protein [Hyphomicrobiaceae bacterium]